MLNMVIRCLQPFATGTHTIAQQILQNRDDAIIMLPSRRFQIYKNNKMLEKVNI